MKIIEDEKTGELIIGSTRISGFIDSSKCEKCGHSIIYSDKFDAYFCPKCNDWIEPKCKDTDCSYCSNRPKKPF